MNHGILQFKYHFYKVIVSKKHLPEWYWKILWSCFFLDFSCFEKHKQILLNDDPMENFPAQKIGLWNRKENKNRFFLPQIRPNIFPVQFKKKLSQYLWFFRQAWLNWYFLSKHVNFLFVRDKICFSNWNWSSHYSLLFCSTPSSSPQNTKSFPLEFLMRRSSKA